VFARRASENSQTQQNPPSKSVNYPDPVVSITINNYIQTRIRQLGAQKADQKALNHGHSSKIQVENIAPPKMVGDNIEYTLPHESTFDYTSQLHTKKYKIGSDFQRPDDLDITCIRDCSPCTPRRFDDYGQTHDGV
jgi:hypothetical protein